MNAPIKLDDIIYGLFMEGKTNYEIAHFIPCDITRVRRLTNSYTPQKLEEVWESVKIRNEHRTNPPQKVRGFITPHPQGTKQALEQRGNFLDSQEGRDTLERISAPYEQDLPETYRLPRAVQSHAQCLLSDRGTSWTE